MSHLPRRRDWPERFVSFLESRRYMPFAWGANDCCLFAADGILEITGVDVAAQWRGYGTDREALALMQRVGGLRGFAASLVARHPGRVQRGEVVLVELEGRETFGLVGGNGHYCGPGADGLIFRPMSEVRIAFGY